MGLGYWFGVDGLFMLRWRVLLLIGEFMLRLNCFLGGIWVELLIFRRVLSS